LHALVPWGTVLLIYTCFSFESGFKRKIQRKSYEFVLDSTTRTPHLHPPAPPPHRNLTINLRYMAIVGACSIILSGEWSKITMSQTQPNITTHVSALEAHSDFVKSLGKAVPSYTVLAAYHGHLAVMKWLIAHGADINAHGEDRPWQILLTCYLILG